jgi:uncharacterized RDD family membrane protein YckC
MAPVSARGVHFVIDGLVCQIGSGLAASSLGIPAGISTWAVTVGVFFVYFLATEALFQRTLAKLITGTKVVMLDGSKPNLDTILIRTVWRFVPLEPLFGISSGVWWHDDRSNTVVKYISTIREEERLRRRESAARPDDGEREHH